MNWKAYKRQLEADLPRWRDAGYVDAAGSEGILADVEARTPPSEAAPWLALTGIVLGGLALIALVADNWGGIPRLMKLVVLLGLFWAALGGALWADRRARPWAINGFSVLASLVFAASLGLLGQSLNMSGDPTSTLLYGSLGAFLIALAARSSASGVLGLVFGGIWFANVSPGFLGLGDTGSLAAYDLTTAGLIALGVLTAWVCRSRVMLHALLAVTGIYILSVSWRLFEDAMGSFLAAAIWGPAALSYGIAGLRDRAGAGAVAGWAAWHFWIAFALAGVGFEAELAHRILWLGVSIGLLAAGAGLRHGWISAAGIVSLIGAATALMVDLGVALTTAALIFAVAAAGAGALAYVLRGRAKGGAE